MAPSYLMRLNANHRSVKSQWAHGTIKGLVVTLGGLLSLEDGGAACADKPQPADPEFVGDSRVRGRVVL